MKRKNSLVAFPVCLIFLLLCQENKTKEQQKTMYYSFTDKCRTLSVKRIYLSDSVFTEIHSNPKTKEEAVFRDTFKIVNGKWYYLLNNDFTPLFSQASFDNRDTLKQYMDSKPKKRDDPIMYPSYSYVPKFIDTIDGKKVLVYDYLMTGEPTGYYQGYSDLIYIDLEFGIIRMQNPYCGISNIRFENE